jgi:hypothetical protein
VSDTNDQRDWLDRRRSGSPVRSPRMAATPQPPWPEVIDKLCAVLASTDWPGLIGSEIGRHLQVANIADPNPDFTKRHRLQRASRPAEPRSVEPSPRDIRRRRSCASALHRRTGTVRRLAAADQHEVLSMVGLRVTDEGQMARVRQAQTLDEVAELAGRLRGARQRRGVHPQVLAYCEVEVLRLNLPRRLRSNQGPCPGLRARLLASQGEPLAGAWRAAGICC